MESEPPVVWAGRKLNTDVESISASIWAAEVREETHQISQSQGLVKSVTSRLGCPVDNYLSSLSLPSLSPNRAATRESWARLLLPSSSSYLRFLARVVCYHQMRQTHTMIKSRSLAFLSLPLIGKPWVFPESFEPAPPASAWIDAFSIILKRKQLRKKRVNEKWPNNYRIRIKYSNSIKEKAALAPQERLARSLQLSLQKGSRHFFSYFSWRKFPKWKFQQARYFQKSEKSAWPSERKRPMVVAEQAKVERYPIRYKYVDHLPYPSPSIKRENKSKRQIELWTWSGTERPILHRTIRERRSWKSQKKKGRIDRERRKMMHVHWNVLWKCVGKYLSTVL